MDVDGFQIEAFFGSLVDLLCWNLDVVVDDDEDDEIYCLDTVLCETVVVTDVFVLVLGGQLLLTVLSLGLLNRLKPYLESLEDDIALCNNLSARPHSPN